MASEYSKDAVMMKFNRLLQLLARLLGILGVVACVAAIVIAWSAHAQLRRTSEQAFDGIDNALAAVQGRTLRAKNRIEASKISTDDIRQSVQTWTAQEASKRLAAQLDVATKVDKLALHLQQADLWLETSENSIRSVQQALDLGRSLGAPIDARFVDVLLEQLQATRRGLKQSTKTVDGIRDHLTNPAEGEQQGVQVDEVVQAALRVAATLSEVDTRLSKFAERLADAQTKAGQIESKTRTYLLIMAIGAALFIAWMMAGQIALWRCGRARQVYDGPAATAVGEPPSNAVVSSPAR